MVDLLLRAASDAVVSVYGSRAYPATRYVISQWRNVPGGGEPGSMIAARQPGCNQPPAASTSSGAKQPG